ncbi:MAG: hypothetical protein OEQ29_23975, partial [Alphaproteobacteria bacterium]|nr:hypothetical protein [Alphaproteobacteria bacterium]
MLLDMEHVSFSLSDVLDEVVRQAGPAAGGRNAREIFSVSAAVPGSLTGDAATLGRVLSALLSNSFECAGAGKIVVDADVVGNGPDQRQRSLILRFTVRRDGAAGLSCDEAANFLMKLSAAGPADGGTTDADARLSLSELADRLEGSIAVASRPGRGFAVSFTAEVGTDPEATAGFEEGAGSGPENTANV